MQRTLASQEAHDRLVQQLAELLVEKRFRDVRADINGSDALPEKIFCGMACSGTTPDVTAVGIQHLLFEVETTDSLDDEHIREEWPLFASYARDRSAEFWVVVPKESKRVAITRMEQLGIEPRVMGI